MWTIDFETNEIEDWPDYPPFPVSVAVKHDDDPATFYAWGHPSGNNTDYELVTEVLKDIWDSGEELLFQNSKFDLAVAYDWFGLPFPNWERVHDTQFLIFLHDHLADTFSLKPSAERILGIPPEEQDALREWLVANHVIASNVKNWGGHISKIPADVVGPYCIGDVDRTRALYNVLSADIVEREMWDSYNRERELAPILLKNEFEGIRIDVPRLAQDVKKYDNVFRQVSKQIKSLLFQFNEEFNIDSGPQLASALRSAGMTVPDHEWPKTPTGKFSTSRDTLSHVLTNDEMQVLLVYRGVLKTLLGTFMKPWLEKAEANDGVIHPSWNQVKGEKFGAKTGRLSCSDPNLQNVPTEMDKTVPEGYPKLPQVRQYILPDEDQVFVSADFHSQEIRMLGHYAGGFLEALYNRDPSADAHAIAASLLSELLGLTLTRKHTKIIAFSILYGAGDATTAERLGVDKAEARRIKNAYLQLLRGVREFMDRVEDRARAKLPVRSWGGRQLFAPQPEIMKDGRVWNKDYVLLNYLIQGSSADQTKQAIIEYNRTKKHGRFLVTVHDEICISVAPEHILEEISILRAAMEKGEFDLPMRVTISTGPNWASLEK